MGKMKRDICTLGTPSFKQTYKLHFPKPPNSLWSTHCICRACSALLLPLLDLIRTNLPTLQVSFKNFTEKSPKKALIHIISHISKNDSRTEMVGSLWS